VNARSFRVTGGLLALGALVLVVLGCGPASQPVLPEKMPSDFGFIAAYGVGARNVIDTFASTFTKDLGPPHMEVSATELRLTREELGSLYKDIVEMQSTWQTFTVPFAPDPDLADTGTTVFQTPHETYQLEWHAGGFDPPPMTWEDSALSSDPKAIALRDWFKKLQQMIEAKSAWKALPPMQGGYE
jgi:hypothetical protein